MVSYCIEHGMDYALVVEKYGVSYNQIYSWVKKFRGIRRTGAGRQAREETACFGNERS